MSKFHVQRDDRNKAAALRSSPNARQVSSTDLDRERQTYAVRCSTCGLDHEVTGLRAASAGITRHLQTAACPRLAVYAEPVSTVEELRERVRTRLGEVTTRG